MKDIIKNALIAYVDSFANDEKRGLFSKKANEVKNLADELISEYNENHFQTLWMQIKTGFGFIDQFPEYENQIYCYDLYGRSNQRLHSLYLNNIDLSNEIPFCEVGSVHKKQMRLVVNPIYVFGGIMKFVNWCNDGYSLSLSSESETNREKEIHDFKDILYSKFREKVPDLFKLLGDHFPDHYTNEGKVIMSRNNSKSILATWYKFLIKHNIIEIVNPSVTQRNKIADLLLDHCNFSNNKLTTKTLFDGELTNTSFKLQIVNLERSIKNLTIK